MAKVGKVADQFVLRMPDGMRERIRRHAEISGRSMNSEAVALLEYGLWEADMARMQAGLEPLREMTDRDREYLQQMRESLSRVEAAKAHSPSELDIPFFDERTTDGEKSDQQPVVADLPLTSELFDKLFKQLVRLENKIDKKADK
ncbi:Arc family DNA-binding protein [Rhizobium ruizarguesonis]